MGLQFIGAEHGEQLLLDIADAYQRANLPSRIPSDFGT
jgi:Asp-tRNA(Asn)/Glu-tRNA(Gln) amidotransferase A subunit family amidase